MSNYSRHETVGILVDRLNRYLSIVHNPVEADATYCGVRTFVQ